MNVQLFCLTNMLHYLTIQSGEFFLIYKIREPEALLEPTQIKKNDRVDIISWTSVERNSVQNNKKNVCYIELWTFLVEPF